MEFYQELGKKLRDHHKEIAVSNAPSIGSNGHWFLNGEDTGVLARGQGDVQIIEVTLLAANWDIETKSQMITVEGISGNELDQVVTVVPAMADKTIYEAREIQCTEFADNSLVLVAATVPTEDILIYVAIEQTTNSASSKIPGFQPEIIIYVEPGASIEVTNGISTFTGVSVGEDDAGMCVIPVDAYGDWTIVATIEGEPVEDSIYIDAVKQYTVTMSMAGEHIYGVSWDGTSTTAWSRTDEAAGFTDPVPYVLSATEYHSPFDNIYPWKGMIRVTDPIAGELVAIPKFWYKWTKSGNSLKLQIATYEADGFSVSPAHMDRGDGYGERDVVYVSRYACSSSYKSETGNVPITDITRATARNSISALGDEYWQFDYAMLWTIRMLYLVEYADWDSQKCIAYGTGSGSSKVSCGSTDDMPYHTGTMLGDRTTYGTGMQYRYIEDLWANINCFVDGIVTTSTWYVVKNPAKFEDTTSNGVSLGGSPSTSTSSPCYPSNFTIPTKEGVTWALYPTGSGGSDSSYISDGYYYSSSYPVVSFGGNYKGQNRSIGLFCHSNAEADGTRATCGCRIMKLPNN